MKHNNVLPNQHFRKEWQHMVKTWFDQPLNKRRRRLARKAKAAKNAPRPAGGALRPVVRCQTVKYNIRVRAGRGFTLDELRGAGINPKEAGAIGIAVDHRRRNKSADSLNANIERLKAHLERLVVFPRRSGAKSAAKESRADTQALREKLQEDRSYRSAPAAVTQPTTELTFATIDEGLAKFGAYRTLRQERANAKMVGKRAKKAAEKAEKSAKEGGAAAE